MVSTRKMINRMEAYTLTNFRKSIDDCNSKERYIALVKALMEDIVPRWINSLKKHEDKKKAYYFSAEYLMGRALSNNLINMKLQSEIKDLLEELDIDYNSIEETEEDPGLGNGGLGRLAACFLDSAATLNYPLMGYGIRYEYGIFRQRFKDGFQVEEGDDWLQFGDPWSIRRDNEKVLVSFADSDVIAVPYDTPIIGYGGKTINTLRLWQAEAVNPFDLEQFNQQNYHLSIKERNDAEIISKVLYPNDTKDEGKILRLKQQYFFVSASLQDLVRNHLSKYDTLDNFHEHHAIQLNDTHPTVAIPEMMRILTDIYGMDWDKSWEIVINTFAYTNHTIMQEALERWPVKFYKILLPKVYKIIERINEDLVEELKEKGISYDAINQYKIIEKDNINMAYLAINGTHSTNGVAKVHSDILAKRELNNWYKLYPERFNNKTNGITQRRWLLKANPELSEFITELLGSELWITKLEELKKLEKYKDDENVLKRFLDIKQIKKNQLAEYIKKQEGIEIDPYSIFDIQIKRIHEYKRQLLNAFHVLDLYYRLKENPDLDMVNRTFIFGGKAAPGYHRAKGIIKYINEIKELINNDKDIDGKIKVVFITNYGVSYGEKLFPAADISEQISTAGKEASGTGNMKFMLNGTPTIGTLDGANIEIVEEAGEDNNFIFGLRVEEIENLKNTYNPKEYYQKTEGLKRVVDSLVDGTFSDGNTGVFKELYDSILEGASWHRPDMYYLMKDFDSYRDAHKRVNDAYTNRMEWAKKCWINMVNAGKFSSDRTIEQYAKEIWGIKN